MVERQLGPGILYLDSFQNWTDWPGRKEEESKSRGAWVGSVAVIRDQ